MDVIGRYQLVEKLGQGGMGIVYRAFDTLLERVVALKVISGNLEIGPEQRERFFREARAAGQLSHRNIIIVHDLGEFEGQPYLAMEYLQGKDLQRRLAAPDRMSIARKVDLILQVCEGLEYAHSHGVIHRDIKPANIFLADNGIVKLLDFGLARLVTSELTNSNMMMGTVNYMAPEQVRGERADSRSDIFSVGVVLYELLGGRKAFDAESFAATMYKILQEEPEPLAALDPRLPHELIAIVNRALAKRRDERYQHVGDVLRDLAVCRPSLDAPEFRSGERPSSDKHARHSDPPQPRPVPGHSPGSDAPTVARPSGTRAIPAAARSAWFAGGAAALALVMVGLWATRPKTPSTTPTAAAAIPSPKAAVPEMPVPPAIKRAEAAGASSAGTVPDRSTEARQLADLARARAADAKSAARAAGAPEHASAAYGAALAVEHEAQRLYDHRELAAAAPKFYEASGLFTSAEIAARTPAAARRQATDRAAEGQHPQSAPAPAAAPPLEPAVPAPSVAAAAPEVRPAPPPVRVPEPAPVVSAPVATPPLTPSAPPDIAPDGAVTDLLSRYKDALESRNIAALKRVWPGLSGAQESALRNEFQHASQLTVEISSPHVVVSGAAATATFMRQYELQTTDGQRLSSESRTTMTFKRTPSGWIIDSVRFDPVR